MTPTLFGRWQTRGVMLATLGVLVTLVFAQQLSTVTPFVILGAVWFAPAADLTAITPRSHRDLIGPHRGGPAVRPIAPISPGHTAPSQRRSHRSHRSLLCARSSNTVVSA